MSILIKILLFFVIFETIFCPPIQKPSEKSQSIDNLHYKEYLEEIVKELEKDKKFAESIKNAQEHNKTEHISQSLVFVNHNIRNKLDEIKRKEIERLNILEKELERRKLEAQGKSVPPPDSLFDRIISADRGHLDHINPHSFEISDLEKLMRKTDEDLNWIDTKQEEEYKKHELKKEYLKKKKIQSIKDPKEQAKLSKQFEESEKRHDNHSKVHHPGNQEQLKEVWEKSDNLDPKEFNAKSFFEIHDINADGHLDINEVEALFQNELSKVYEANNTDDDMQERYHEMMRMRHEMMKSFDSNSDNLISKEEFMKYSSSLNFKDDSNWKTDEETEEKPYTDKELNEYIYGLDAQGDEEDEFSDQDEALRFNPEDNKIDPSNIQPVKVDDVIVVKKEIPPVQEQHPQIIKGDDVSSSGSKL